MVQRPRPPQFGPDNGDLRVNRQIRIREIFLIDEHGEKIGVIPTEEAMARARAAGLDLVEVSPNARPPVAKILDYGKYKYRQKKKQAGQKTHQAKIKEVRLHPRTDDHDVEVRLKQAHRFLDEGDKVLVNCQFKGREMAHREFGERLLDRFKAGLAMIAKVEKDISMEGKRMTLLLAPLAADVRKKLEKQAEEQMAAASVAEAGKRRVITLEEAKKSVVAADGAAPASPSPTPAAPAPVPTPAPAAPAAKAASSTGSNRQAAKS